MRLFNFLKIQFKIPAYYSKDRELLKREFLKVLKPIYREYLIVYDSPGLAIASLDTMVKIHNSIN